MRTHHERDGTKSIIEEKKKIQKINNRKYVCDCTLLILGFRGWTVGRQGRGDDIHMIIPDSTP
jgi:hypothetical protein